MSTPKAFAVLAFCGVGIGSALAGNAEHAAIVALLLIALHALSELKNS